MRRDEERWGEMGRDGERGRGREEAERQGKEVERWRRGETERGRADGRVGGWVGRQAGVCVCVYPTVDKTVAYTAMASEDTQRQTRHNEPAAITLCA